MAESMAQYEDHVWDFFSDIPEKYEESFCIFCREQTKSAIKFTKYYLKIAQCECGFVYLHNQPTPAALVRFYENSKALETWAEIKTSNQELERQRSKFSRAIDQICEGGGSPSVLDVGCGNGVFLRLLREKMPKARTVGVDTNISASKVAEQANSLIIRQDLYSFLRQPEGIFDWITLWGVLEHVKDPGELSQLIKDKLTKNGKVIVCVPNINSLISILLGKDCFTFCPQHLWYFSISSLKRLFKDFTLKDFWTIEPEDQPIRRVTEGHRAYDKTATVSTQTNITTPKKTYSDLSEYILDNDLGYKIVAVFSL